MADEPCTCGWLRGHDVTCLLHPTGLRIAELELERDAARARIAAWEAAATDGHPTPCTLGPLCPYCEIERLRARLDGAVQGECDAMALVLNHEGHIEKLTAERDALAAKFSKELTETLLAYDAKWQPVVDALAARVRELEAENSMLLDADTKTVGENNALAAEVAGLRQLAWDGWEQAVLWEQTEHACDTQYDRLAERVARLVATARAFFAAREAHNGAWLERMRSFRRGEGEGEKSGLLLDAMNEKLDELRAALAEWER